MENIFNEYQQRPLAETWFEIITICLSWSRKDCDGLQSDTGRNILETLRMAGGMSREQMHNFLQDPVLINALASYFDPRVTKLTNTEPLTQEHLNNSQHNLLVRVPPNDFVNTVVDRRKIAIQYPLILTPCGEQQAAEWLKGRYQKYSLGLNRDTYRICRY